MKHGNNLNNNNRNNRNAKHSHWCVLLCFVWRRGVTSQHLKGAVEAPTNDHTIGSADQQPFRQTEGLGLQHWDSVGRMKTQMELLYAGPRCRSQPPDEWQLIWKSLPILGLGLRALAGAHIVSRSQRPQPRCHRRVAARIISAYVAREFLANVLLNPRPWKDNWTLQNIVFDSCFSVPVGLWPPSLYNAVMQNKICVGPAV